MRLHDFRVYCTACQAIVLHEVAAPSIQCGRCGTSNGIGRGGPPSMIPGYP